MINLKNTIFTKRYTVKVRLIFFVFMAIFLIVLISFSAVIGLSNTYHSLSNLRDRSLNQLFSSMTLGVKTSQISTYSTRLSQTIRALEYKEASEQLEQHIQQVHLLLNDVEKHAGAKANRPFADLVQSLRALEQSVKELLHQAYRRHIVRTTIISKLNQSLLHIRHIKRLQTRDPLSGHFLPPLSKIENLIEDATRSSYSPSTFLSIQAMFSFLPAMTSFPAIEQEWHKVEQAFDDVIKQSDELNRVNLRILFLTNQIDALVNHIDKNYSRLAGQKTQEVNGTFERLQGDLSRYILSVLLLAGFIILLVIILGRYIYRLIGTRLSSITEALIRLSKGDKNATVPQQQTQDEIGDLARAFDVFHQNVVKLDQTDALLQQTFLAMRDGLAIFDKQYKLVSYNAQFALLLGLEQAVPQPEWNLPALVKFMRRHHAAVYGSERAITVELLCEMRREQEPLEIVFNHLIFEWRISFLQDGGLVAFLIDRTQRRKLESELAHSQKMRTIGHLTGGIAHDFNNLLAVIIGNLDMIDPATLTEKQAKRLHNALKAAENSATLTQRLLAYARKQPLYPGVLDINQLLMDFAELMEHSLPATVKVRLDLAENLPPVYIDKNQLETALVNLILNAKDALDGEGEILIKSCQLLVQRTYKKEQMVQIAIIDHGCGMDDTTRKQIFEPFFTTKKNGKGSGLGLSMVYGFIRQSKGRVIVQSEPGSGTCVNLQLPLAVQPQTHSDENRDLMPRNNDMKSVLLVEDQPALRDTLAEQLREMHYLPIVFETGEQATDYVKQGNCVDYLLSDIVLTGKINGIDVAQRVRQHCPACKILLMTGNYRESADKSVKFPVLNKPFKPAALQRMLSRL
ncbi:ATP-binding protein [Necropsobacter rosorum]|uniref:ATP-binding protein n=1 Tax=Pasteurellaceae TaxID=712 RepID=UPI004026F36A